VSRRTTQAELKSASPLGVGILQRKCACGQHTEAGECEECKKKKESLQRKGGNAGEPVGVPPIVHEVLRSPGWPLDPASRDFMESRFGRDFSRVRIHADARAANSAQAMAALAYTVGQDVVFADGSYQPASQEGRRLLAHELAHTVQQGDAKPATALAVVAPDHPSEAEADRAADVAIAAGPMSPLATSAGNVLQRQPKPSVPGSSSASQPTPPTPAQIYQQALPKVQTLDPAIFALLSKAKLGAGPQLVLNDQMQGPSGTLPIIVEIKLEVTLGPLLSSKDAEMRTASRRVQDPAANKFELTGTMTINSAMQGTTPDALSQVLAHEGVHFQIAMDKLVSSQSQSAHAGSFGKYVQTAKVLPSQSALTAQLDLYMEKVLTQKKLPTDPTSRFKDVRKIMDLVIEEKYVYDQDKKRFGAVRSNRKIASDYVVDGLDAIGIPPSANVQPDLGNLITLAEKFLNELDAQLSPPPAPAPQPAPPPSGSGKPSAPP
jgi:uncharacterized protein DUF4157